MPSDALAENPASRNPLPAFLIGLVAGALALAATLTALVLGQLGNTHLGSLWVDQVVEKKLAAARAATGPKILLISGSNSMFGINSRLLEATYGRPVVNLGVNAGLLLPLVLENAKPAMGQGDIALVPLEYPLYYHDGEINQVLVDYLLSRADRFWQQSLWTKMRVIAYASLPRLREGYKGLPPGYVLTGFYGPHRIDAHGDQIGTSRAERTPALHNEALATPVRWYGRETHPDAEGWRILRDFGAYARARGTCLIFVPSAFMERPPYRQDPVERRFYEEIPRRVRALGFSYVGEPHDFMMPPEEFLNTDYHLVDEARQVFTRKLIAALGPDLQRHCQGQAERRSREEP